MDDPNRRARDRDRDDAIDLVEAAWAEGQIVELDRDRRVEQLPQAQTLGEIELLVRDLQRPPPSTAVRTAAPPPAPPPAPAAPRRPWRWALPAAVVAVAVGSLVAGTVAAVDQVGTGVEAFTDQVQDALPVEPPGVAPDVHSARGLADLVAAVREESGSTRVHRAVIYPTYASLELPVPGRDGVARSFYWDGTLRGNESITPASGPAFDLAAVDPKLARRALAAAGRLVDEPVTSYLILKAPDDDGATVWGYASDDAGRSGYVSFDRRGQVVRRVPPS